MIEWSKRTWLITGCSTGLGRAIADAVLAAGGNVVATARDPVSVADLAAAHPDCCIALALDVTDQTQIDAAVHAAEARFGAIDVLVNNAGYGFLGGIEEASEIEIRTQFEVNFFGLAAVTRAVLPGMRARRSGYVVNLSSILGMCGLPAAGWYAASKFAVEGLSESLAAEGAPLGIKVMVVEPGPFRTDFNGRSIRMPARTIADYEVAVAVRAGAIAGDGSQPGDPARAAVALLTAINSDTPPLRLPLGRLASDMLLDKHESRAAEVREGRILAIASDYPE